MTVLHLVALLAPLTDAVPEDDDVVAGWGGFAVFVGLAVAVALLGWSLVRQLRKTERNAARGVFGPPPARDDRPEDGDQEPDERRPGGSADPS